VLIVVLLVLVLLVSGAGSLLSLEYLTRGHGVRS
jgi:hypothetical protein